MGAVGVSPGAAPGGSPQLGPRSSAGASSQPFGAVHAAALKEGCRYPRGYFLAAVYFPGRESAWGAVVGDGIPTGARVGMSSQDPLPKFGAVYLI